MCSSDLIALAIRAVAGELAILEPSALVPGLGRCIVDPGGVGAGEGQHVEAVTVLLVGVGDGIRDVAVLLDLPLHGVRGHALARVAVGAVDDALATVVTTQPEQGVVQLGHGERGGQAQLVEGTLNARQREVRVASVIPDFSRVCAEDPNFAVVNDNTDYAVGRTLDRKSTRLNSSH